MRVQLGFGSLAALMLPGLCLGDQGTAPTPGNLTASLMTVPPCALPCLAENVIKANCSASDPQCICVDKYTQISDSATPCILEKCALVDALCHLKVTKNVTESVCRRPIRDKSGQYDAMNLSMGVITALLVVVRLIYKKFYSYRREFGYDDWAILFTLIFGIPCTVINTVGLTAHGLGRDVWTVPPAQLTTFVEYFFIIEILYLAEMAIIKLSLSLFYLSIFPGTIIRRLLLGTCILNVIFGIVFVTMGIFACTPVSRYWTQYVEKDSTGHCINLNMFAWIHAALNIALDVWMIALPLSQVKGLELHWKKKFGVVFMFLIGTFVTIVSILRLQTLIYFANSRNPTWDNWIIGWWSTIEVNVGMICTCMPTLRLILVRLAPRIFSTNVSNNQSHGTHTAADRFTRNSNIMGYKQFELTSIETSAMEREKPKGKFPGV
ncbi:hypothetical protein QQS21_004017 [Conoideocrella luteorostrata]|uniref:Extracellular membrane protein CFEM domain-containing protein n=1 Tax=Conoideocrella luteorostrata TaxID=1105319 RepID=A0AAJ0CV85_9HYPO|nr:hypothetical protein QQS21_004017 [Conoideocrella luteorostrata]